uniref:MYND-type domain-containing protein n=1 Tax=Tetradesmus obliquus TaxID=3088 RepID=A0A383VUM1_TETOB|eukprot:jgi/Sobl393_1/3123/SZX69187.1
MPPTQQPLLLLLQQQQAEDAARLLSTIVNNSSITQLLQHPPPAVPTAQQQEVLQSCVAALITLMAVLPQGEQQHQGGQAVRSAGSLFVWALQRPDLIDPDQLEAPSRNFLRTLSGLFCHSYQTLADIAVAVLKTGSSSSSGGGGGRSVGMLAAAMTQQLEQSGVLSALPSILRATIEHATQQRQQQQLTGDWRLVVMVLTLLSSVTLIWQRVACSNPAMLRTVLPAALELQHLQAAGQLLPADATSAASTNAAGSSSRRNCSSSSGSSSSSRYAKEPHGAFFEVQLTAGLMLFQLCKLLDEQGLGGASEVQVEPTRKLMGDLAVSEMLLQLLAPFAMMLHKTHVTHRAEQQQQQQQQQGPSAASHSSSSSSSSLLVQASQQTPKQQLRADLLPIPAFHQHEDMLQLLPGGQAYLEAAAWKIRMQAVAAGGSEADTLDRVVQQTLMFVQAMTCSLKCLLDVEHPGRVGIGGVTALSAAAAVQLVLELQLLAAGEVQRQRAASQQQQQQQQQHNDESDMLESANKLLFLTNELLQVQIRGALQATGSSCLPPEVLQQAGLQLLQALAAPLQQLQLGGAPPGELGPVPGCVRQQLLAFKAAGSGMTPGQFGNLAVTAPSQLPALAAAHPEAYTALVDCFLRSLVTDAFNLTPAAEVLTHALAAVLGSQELLGRSVAVASLVSAVASLVKRAVQFVTATSLHAAGRWPAAVPASLRPRLAAAAAACYPAAVPPLVSSILTPCAAQLLEAASTVSSTGSATAGSQAAASVALLAVVLARSAVQLADAMEDAEDVQWEAWQLLVLRTVQSLLCCLSDMGIAPLSKDAEAPALRAAAAAAAAPAGPTAAASSSSSNSNSSRTLPAASSSSRSSSQQIKWSHLLQVHLISPEWAAAVAAFIAKWPRFCKIHLDLLHAELEDGAVLVVLAVEQQYADAVELCRTLVAAAPLPVVCNNPGCEDLADVSEAAACCKACAGCRCRYCSVACQKADWKRHKHACKRMAAAGQSCV